MTMTTTEPTAATSDAQFARRQAVASCLLLTALPLGAYGQYVATTGGLVSVLASLLLVLAALVAQVLAVRTAARKPLAWLPYRWHDRLPTTPLWLLPVSLAGVVGWIGLLLSRFLA